MSGTAGQDEDVPGGVEITESIESEEDDTQGVGEASGGKPKRSLPTDGVNQGTRGKDDEPSLKEVDEGRSDGETFDSDAFEDDSCGGQGPDDGEQGPADGAAERDQGEGRVGAGDEEVDGGVVEHLEDVPSAGTNQRVIEGGADVDEDKGGGEDRAADDEPRGAARGGCDEID